MAEYRNPIRDGMRVGWDVPIPMDDGNVLRCDIFRPVAEGRYPVLMAMGPYAKWMHFSDLFKDQWNPLHTEHPEVLANSTGRYLVYEQLDPERFVPDGYVVVRINSRGAGRSPGFLDVWSAREAQDYHDCIEWAAQQPWCSGKVGLSGISYLAMNQWQVAALQPPHLSAMFVFEGAADYYRDMVYHGGILCTFGRALYGPAIVANQHGRGKRGYRSRIAGDWVSGPETLTEEELGSNRRDWYTDCIEHRFVTDEFWTSRLPDFSKINVPFLSAGNLGGQGSICAAMWKGFCNRRPSTNGWSCTVSSIGPNTTPTMASTCRSASSATSSRAKTRAGATQPRVQIQVRHPGERFVLRHEHEWPLARTRWTKLYLDPQDALLRPQPTATRGQASYRGMSDGVIFLTPPLQEDMEITGPIVVKLFVSSSTADADIFVVLRAFHPDLKELIFSGQTDRIRRLRRGGCVPRGASSIRLSRFRIGPTTCTTRTRSSCQGRSTSSISRCCRPAWCCPRVIASGLRSAAATTFMAAAPAAPLGFRGSSPASAVSVTTRRATGRRRSSTATSRCIAAGIAPRM